METRHNGTALLGAIGIGAALMYFLDPDRGSRRRKLALDQLVHTRHVAGDTLGATKRDLGNRARGVAATTRSRFADDHADGRVIEERVRAELGRIVSHPHAIEVTAEGGHVTLSGPILAHEAEELERQVRKVRGVTEVENHLDVHERAEGVPSLQGGGGPRR